MVLLFFLPLLTSFSFPSLLRHLLSYPFLSSLLLLQTGLQFCELEDDLELLRDGKGCATAVNFMWC